MDEFRIWKDALDRSTISDWKDKGLDDTHPNYENLTVYYSMNSFDEYTLKDESGNGYDAALVGAPAKKFYPTMDQTLEAKPLVKKPQITFIEGDYETNTESKVVSKKMMNPPMPILTYELDGRGVTVTDIEYAWAPGKFYTFDPDGIKIDSIEVASSGVKAQETLEYHTEPSEKKERWELGRYITPYGINLSLGAEGFLWQYDVTDYAQMLQGRVDIQGHNKQELIDLEFYLTWRMI